MFSGIESVVHFTIFTLAYGETHTHTHTPNRWKKKNVYAQQIRLMRSFMWINENRFTLIKELKRTDKWKISQWCSGRQWADKEWKKEVEKEMNEAKLHTQKY